MEIIFSIMRLCVAECLSPHEVHVRREGLSVRRTHLADAVLSAAVVAASMEFMERRGETGRGREGGRRAAGGFAGYGKKSPHATHSTQAGTRRDRERERVPGWPSSRSSSSLCKQCRVCRFEIESGSKTCKVRS